jgi:hypothetical protein
MTRSFARALAASALFAFSATAVRAHSGPPFPIVSDRIAGAYDVSVWTDPDATDDGSAAGQFWVLLHPANRQGSVPPDTRASVTITPLDGGSARAGRAEPVKGDVERQFVALVMDHEGRFHVKVAIGGPLGPAIVETDVDATYDLRPAPFLVLVYVMPFLAVGFLWIKLLIRRRQPSTPGK